MKNKLKDFGRFQQSLEGMTDRQKLECLSKRLKYYERESRKINKRIKIMIGVLAATFILLYAFNK